MRPSKTQSSLKEKPDYGNISSKKDWQVMPFVNSSDLTRQVRP
jgi:hypothetical protein